MSQSRVRVSRRSFLGTTAAGAAGWALGSSRMPVLGANDRVGVGIVGIGAQGGGLTRTLSTLPAARITTVCDIFEPNMKKGVDLAGSRPTVFTDFRKLIENKDVDAVLIALPLHLHAVAALSALNAGKHVFVEKTMAYSIGQCEQMVGASKKNPKLVVQVGHQHRFDPVINRVVEMCRQGALGTITHIRCHWHRNGNWRRPVPKSDFDPQAWGYPSLDHLINWRMYRKYSGGLMCELGSHMIEIVNLIYGGIPAAVTGMGGIDYWKDGRETYDNVSVVYSYPAGQKAIFTSTTTNAHDGEKMTIMGTDATVEMGWNQALYFREKEAPELVKVDGATVITATGETMKQSEQSQAEGKKVEMPAVRISAVYRELEAFVSSIRDGRKADVDFQVGRNAAVSVLLANRAMREGRVLKF